MAYEAQASQPEPDKPEAGGEKVLRIEDIAAQGTDLAFLLPDDVLGRISAQCLEAYERDKGERAEWEGDYDRSASMLSGKRTPKSFPWPGASNVIYPLMLTATLQFGSRAYPAIIKGKDVAKIRVNGADPDGTKKLRGERIKEHMNWQLLEDMPEWEDETDKLVHMLPWQGCVFRQTIWDKTYTRPCSSLISAKSLVVTQNCKDLETVPIFCKEFTLFPHELTERMRDGRYVEIDLKLSDKEEKQGEQDMLECHCRYDLDEDDYSEPWIAVIHKDTGKLLSLKAGFWPKGVERGEDGRVAKVKRHVEFTKYDFIPDFEGKFLGVGFGYLLREHNEIINTLINQLIDAGTSENAGGGFIGKGVNLKGGSMDFALGEYKYVNASGDDIRKAIVDRPVPQPSTVLFQMLGLMIESGKELASITDALTGDVKDNVQPTTLLALIEQGLQVFSAINKRIFRAMGKELGLIYQLNSAYLPDQAYYYVLDDQKAIARQDYAEGDFDVRPVADPSVATSAQRLARAQFLGGFVANGPDPDVNSKVIKRRMMEAADIENIDEIITPDPDPMQQQSQAMMAERAANAEVTETEMSAEDKKASAIKKSAETVKIMQEAALAPLQMELDARVTDQSNKTAERKIESDERTRMGRMGGVAGASKDAKAAGPSQAAGAVPQVPMGGEPVGPDGPGPDLGQPAGLPGALTGL